MADGSILTFAQNPALGSVIGDQFGGNGSTTYALPNLLGRVAAGANATNPIGTQFVQAATTLTTAQLPPGGTAVNNDQPSLAVNYIIATQGIFPSQGGVSGGFNQSTATLGEIVAFAGNFAPAGWAFADGQTLLDTSYEALFNIIGTMYGSGGPGTFDLPNLDGRTIIGTDGGSLLPGFEEGVDENFLTAANIPTTSSTVPEPASAALLGLGLAGLLTARRRGRGQLVAQNIARLQQEKRSGAAKPPEQHVG